MEFGPVFFVFALFPVLIFLYTLQNLRRSLHDPKARRRAAVGTLAMLLLGPVVIAVFMMIESSIDPDFMMRSFSNPEGKGVPDLFLFAVDQTLKGTLFDAMEIFRITIGSLQHKCDSSLFCIALLLYRISMGTVISIFLLTWLLRLQHMIDRLTGSKDKTPKDAGS